MNILLITDLYPAYEGQPISEISYALHYFVRQWIKIENVLVIRPCLLNGINWQYFKYKKKEFTFDGVRIINSPVVKIPKFKIFFLKPIYNIIKQNKVDIIIAHLGFNLFFGYKIANKLNIPLISAVHNGDLRFGIEMLSEELLKLIYEYSTGIACRSQSLYQKFTNWSPEFKNKCFIAYSGIDKKIIQTDMFIFKKMTKWHDSKKVIFISVCSLIELKNIDVNILVLSKLDKKIQWEYRIIGIGDEESRLKKLSLKLNLSDRVKFLGLLTRENVIKELKKSNVFIMVSSYETFGIAYLEAMATGNIVIASKGNGIDGVIVHKKNGFLCSPKDENDLLKIINKIVLYFDFKHIKEILINSISTIHNYTEKKAANNYLQEIYSLNK